MSGIGITVLPYQTCCISLNRDDRLRLIGCHPQLIPEMRSCIMSSWGSVQKEKSYYGSYEFKLAGTPWSPEGQDTVRSRRLLTGMLTVMARHGWNVIQATDCSKKEGAKDCFFFEQGMADLNPSLHALSFNKFDRIRIIDAPELLPALEAAVNSAWPWKIEERSNYAGSTELKLYGNPWYPEGKEAVHSKVLLAQIISNFKAAGYKLYTSVKICGKEQNKIMEGDLDSWVFRKVGPYGN